jgi:hypothetical protein
MRSKMRMLKRISLWSLIYLGWLLVIYLLMETSIKQCLPNPECIFVTMLGSSVSSMPMSILWLGFINLILYSFDIFLTGTTGLILSLVGFYALGYFQWFILIPLIWRKICTLKKPHSTNPH